MENSSVRAAIVVVSRVEAIETAVEQLVPEVVGVISSQEISIEVAVECDRLKDRASFFTAIVDSAVDIQDAFGRFGYLFKLLSSMDYTADEIVLDATGGTTVMRLGTALAAISEGVRMVHRQVPMVWVDGDWKVDEGKQMKIVPMPNPLESTGLLREGQGVVLFDQRSYDAASVIFHDVARKVEGVERDHYYSGLALLAEGYAAWDVADYAGAMTKLKAAKDELSVDFANAVLAGQAKRLTGVIVRNLAFIGKFQGSLSAEAVVDMLENARRRIEDQRRYDDGVARLYRCIEMLHQNRLQRRYKISTTSVNWHSVSTEARETFLARTGLETLPEDLDLTRARVLDHILSEADAPEEDVFRDLLQQRNHSILAHGFQPISERAARTFLAYVDGIVERPKLADGASHPYLQRL